MDKRKICLVIFLIILLFSILLIFVKQNPKISENDDKIINELNPEKNEITYDTELFTSTMGYELRYDPDKFDVKYEANSEKFVYKTDDADIYLKLYTIDINDQEAVDLILNDPELRSGDCMISNNELVGKYVRKEFRNDNNVSISNRCLVFKFENKNTLVMEINEYASTESDRTANDYIKNMISTFKYDL